MNLLIDEEDTKPILDFRLSGKAKTFILRERLDLRVNRFNRLKQQGANNSTLKRQLDHIRLTVALWKKSKLLDIERDNFLKDRGVIKGE